MVFKLKYGKRLLAVEIPDSVDVETIEPRPLPAVGNVRDAFISALENPVEAPPLRTIVPTSGKVAIVVSDRTRPCLYPVALPVLLDYLNEQGVPDRRMFLLVAYGAHRQHSNDENRAFYGEEAVRRLRLIHHDCRDELQLAQVGRTTRGTPVQLNRRYVEATASVVLTSVGFHYFAGFGGGRKAIFPGLASEEAILHNHRIFVESGGKSLSLMRRFRQNMEDNPLNEDLMEAVAMAPPSFVVNFCLNFEGNVSRVFAGDWQKSHEHACEFLRSTHLRAERKFDLVIAGCGGHPRDINFIQSHKTMDNAFDFVRPGGTLVVLASCEDGIGSESFLRWFEHEDAASMREALLKNYAMNGGTALALKMKTDNCPIHLYTSLRDDVVQKMGLRPMRDIRQDLAEIVERGTVRLAAVLPEGAVTVAKPE